MGVQKQPFDSHGRSRGETPVNQRIRKSAHKQNSTRININSGRFPVAPPSMASSLGCRMLLHLAVRLSRFTLAMSESIAPSGVSPEPTAVPKI
ncbi:hypothetical protein EVAR_28634_1 [Eumeta japonica]|uniref:Uncharacterized protein n=1 Tax=Eumeta variegata TaxID=151549 RepID=A0A4C1XS39_EUMVA|nr:hypothetical protein EVAR_28634_1 [Eumeta japonica]